MRYDPHNWYWRVDGATDQVFSSASCSFVPVDDEVYAAWLKAGGGPTSIGSAVDLDAVLLQHGRGTKGLVRFAAGPALVKALPKASKNAMRDLAYIAGRASVPETAASVARMAAADGITPKAWFDAVLGVSEVPPQP